MTIVIQHQYWDLEAHDNHFEVILKFTGVPQHLHIPFSAITRFVDPSVNFGITLDQSDAGRDKQIISPAIHADESEPSEQNNEIDAANTVVNLDAFRRK